MKMIQDSKVTRNESAKLSLGDAKKTPKPPTVCGRFFLPGIIEYLAKYITGKMQDAMIRGVVPKVMIKSK